MSELTAEGLLIAELQERVRQQADEIECKDGKIIGLTRQITRMQANRQELLLVYDHTNHGQARTYYNPDRISVKILEVHNTDSLPEEKQVKSRLPRSLQRLYMAGHRDFLASPYDEEITMLRAEIYRTQGTYIRTFEKVNEIRNALSDAVELVKIIKRERDDAVSRLGIQPGSRPAAVPRKTRSGG